MEPDLCVSASYYLCVTAGCWTVGESTSPTVELCNKININCRIYMTVFSNHFNVSK